MIVELTIAIVIFLRLLTELFQNDQGVNYNKQFTLTAIFILLSISLFFLLFLVNKSLGYLEVIKCEVSTRGKFFGFVSFHLIFVYLPVIVLFWLYFSNILNNLISLGNVIVLPALSFFWLPFTAILALGYRFFGNYIQSNIEREAVGCIRSKYPGFLLWEFVSSKYPEFEISNYLWIHLIYFSMYFIVVRFVPSI